jgi:phosphoglucomutase
MYMEAEVQAKVDLWRKNVTEPDLKEELESLIASGNEDQLNDAFYRNLEFGTAGLRGTLGVA